MELNVLPALPASLAELPAMALAEALGGPTLFDLRKGGEPPLFISVLVHGNEVSGWDAVRRLAPRLAAASVLLFVGNVQAARAGKRALPGRVDFNRVWEGGDTPEAAVASAVVAIAAKAAPYLAIDIHNNTGDNPPYAVICRVDRQTLAVARGFSGQALLATQPRGFQTRRFARFCTAATIEVGTPGDPASTDRATAFLADLLAGGMPGEAAAPLTLFETVARVTLADDAVINPDMQRFNFQSAPAGAALTRAGGLAARTADGRAVGEDYFVTRDGATVLRQATTIAMYTGDADIARQDCLCYFLKPATANAGQGATLHRRRCSRHG